MRSDPLTRWRPFAALRRRRERADAAIEALERAAAAVDAERARLAEAVAVSHRALALLHDRLLLLDRQPGRVDALIDHARAELSIVAAHVATAAAERVATEIAPARAAAEEHAAYLRASLDRMRGEAEALDGAREAAAALTSLAGTAQAGFAAAMDALARRSDHAADAAERAVSRLETAVTRVEKPVRRRTATG